MALSLRNVQGKIVYWDSAPSPVCPDSRGDPVLEISVVYGQTQVGIKVVGPLDLETTASFLSVMGDLLLEGFRDYSLDVREAQIDAAGAAALTLCKRRAGSVGATLLCVDA